MATVLPKPPRWTKNGGRFLIPSHKGVVPILTLVGFVVFWSAAFVQGVADMIKEGLSGELGWLLIPAYCCVLFLILVAVYLLAWHLAGREVVEVSGGELALSVEVLGTRRTRSYSLSEISELRSLPVPPGGLRAGSRLYFGNTSGAVAFDYGARTIRFGASLDEAEAKLLVRDLIEQTPSLARAI